MAELSERDFREIQPGYRLNAETVTRDLFRLFVAVTAFQAMGEAGAELKKLRDQHADDEIAHLLVGTAMANRLQLEHMQSLRGDPQELSFRQVDGVCGNWGEENSYDGSKPLHFRETCNKILHTEGVFVGAHESPVKVFLNGKQNRLRWKVQVNLTDYVRLSYQNFAD